MSKSALDFELLIKDWSPIIEKKLEEILPSFPNISDPIWQKAIRSAVFDGGKRTRPFLTIMGWQTISSNENYQIDLMLEVAVAIELIHCSSLIFDDLPCMDNATLRHGTKALHLEIGEDKAILVALALLLKGIELVILVANSLTSFKQSNALVINLMQTIGTNGLICGQWFDLCAKQSVRNETTDAKLLALRNLKTMPLIKFSLLSGAILADANEEQQIALSQFAEYIGDAYQQVDDLLDFIGDSILLGKDVEIDKKNDRLNDAYLSLDQAVISIEEKLEQARSIIRGNFSTKQYPDKFTGLIIFTYYLSRRFQNIVAQNTDK
ncbi:MAG: polyprenyl synthetase family protein [Blastocatellia bacterium]|nr:polyprenyl synthetase family protein [Blastocatellia bacterium]MBL8195736.1 polyprenyl synthetase family protein [Blastocatellia bacterium]MBN8724376.1 polyprenyl synthetase family protein [Acidobacteriota bacterium]